jgi:hypothetical protein
VLAFLIVSHWFSCFWSYLATYGQYVDDDRDDWYFHYTSERFGHPSDSEAADLPGGLPDQYLASMYW